MLRVFKQMDVRNRAYVIDNKGNKLFYGTVYQCGKFINYMNEGGADDESGINRPGGEIARGQIRDSVEQ